MKIDTDKYEGHSTEYSYEILSVDDGKDMYATYALLNDAPLLLAEVKSLREMYEEASRDLHIMIGAFGIELLVETRLGEQE